MVIFLKSQTMMSWESSRFNFQVIKKDFGIEKFGGACLADHDL